VSPLAKTAPSHLSRKSFKDSAPQPVRAATARNMGAEVSTARLDRLTALGFSVAEARIALEQTGGDVARAEQLLLAERRRRAAAGGGLAERINAILRTQRPWPEFFERFLWPEHLYERVQTNLVYYEANYVIICGGISVVSVLLNPSLLLVTGLVGGLFAVAVAWDGDVNALAPQVNLPAPLTLQQRLVAAGLGSSLVVNGTGHTSSICRVALLCFGVVFAHAAFRARSLKARWEFFKEELKAD
jgi:hypothetical protein